ncbi:hypothetical protein L9F63_010185 [Diploptera punctata]|uniref:Uncharacterized protein n=1 Tax=Diploptera punctata TaxID=6984 RepID=A0AAD8AKF0_DIPPU|nr:hypothetical protein L9F63_010185 [Diploptera punctata]
MSSHVPQIFIIFIDCLYPWGKQAVISISHKMAVSMNDFNQNDVIEDAWDVGCASLVPEKSKLR